MQIRQSVPISILPRRNPLSGCNPSGLQVATAILDHHDGRLYRSIVQRSSNDKEDTDPCIPPSSRQLASLPQSFLRSKYCININSPQANSSRHLLASVHNRYSPQTYIVPRTASALAAVRQDEFTTDLCRLSASCRNSSLRPSEPHSNLHPCHIPCDRALVLCVFYLNDMEIEEVRRI